MVASNQKTTAGTIPSNGLTNATLRSNGVKLTDSQRKRLAGPPLANSFTPESRLYRSFEEQSTVFEYKDLDLKAMREMLSKDGNPRKLEQVLSLPIRSADWEIRGKGTVANFVRDTLDPMMDRLISQCCSAIAYRKAFFELVWKLEGDKVVFDQIALRPATSCEAAFDINTGAQDGFRQQLNPINTFAQITQGNSMGWVRVPANRAFIYVYGLHREPIHGVSDLDVSLFCWDNIRKLQFLWCQYLEQQSLPKVIVYGDDPMQAQDNAQIIAESEASAAIPIERRIDPAQKTFELLESSGKGATQFTEAIAYFESKQTQSVLASFMDLSTNASMASAGSNALSADQSEFYLASRQAVANEMAQQITEGIIRPLVAFNFGPDVELPDLHFAPIGNRQTDRALNLLQSIVTAEKPTIPEEFTGFLLNQVSAALGLDTTDVSDAVEAWGVHRQKMMEAAEAAAAAAAEIPTPLTPPSKQQPIAGAAQIAGNTSGQPLQTPAQAHADALGETTDVNNVPRSSNAKARKSSNLGNNKTGTAQGANRSPARVAKPSRRQVKSTSRGSHMTLAIEMAAQLVEKAKAGEDPKEFLRSVIDD